MKSKVEKTLEQGKRNRYPIGWVAYKLYQGFEDIIAQDGRYTYLMNKYRNVPFLLKSEDKARKFADKYAKQNDLNPETIYVRQFYYETHEDLSEEDLQKLFKKETFGE